MKNGGIMMQVFLKKNVNKESWLMRPPEGGLISEKEMQRFPEGFQDMFEESSCDHFG